MDQRPRVWEMVTWVIMEVDVSFGAESIVTALEPVGGLGVIPEAVNEPAVDANGNADEESTMGIVSFCSNAD